MGVASDIRLLKHGEFALYPDHLKRLDARGRGLRFGRDMDDAGLEAHCLSLQRSDGQVLAFLVDGCVRGAAEIALASDIEPVTRNLAVSVEPDDQGCGIGSALVIGALGHVRPHTALLTFPVSNHAMAALANRLRGEKLCENGIITCRIETDRRSHDRDGRCDADGLQPAVFAMAVERK